MSFIKGIYIFVLLTISSSSLAGITLSDIPITWKELIKVGIVPGGLNIIDENKLRSDNQSQVMIVRHVITTGRDRANNQHYFFVNNKTLEQIKPKFSAFTILRTARQTPLSDEQVTSLAQNLKRQDLPQWLLDKQQKKYINTVLQEKNCPNCPIKLISTENSRRLVNWAIKNKHLYLEDHPQ